MMKKLMRLLQKSRAVRLPRRFTPRNDSKDAICHCERSAAILFFRLLQEPLIYIFIVFSMLSPGCKDKAPEGKKPAAQKPAATAIAPSAVVQQEGPKVENEIYVYDPKGRRDPFLSLVQIDKPKVQRKKGASPIENYDLEEIKLIAIASDSKQFYALITLPDKKSYTIKKGMTLGLNNGKVKEITKDSVFIQEQVKNYKGQNINKDITLKLRKEGEE